MPFEWAEIRKHTAANDPGALVMNRRGELPCPNSFVVPVFGLHGFRGFVSLSLHEDYPVRTDKLAAVLLAFYLFDALSNLQQMPHTATLSLTNREKEVLTWVSKGKSAWEIGEILKIAKRTADEHVNRAKFKLGAANRIQAVAIALRNHLIDP